ncbi:MAG: hypothetical protein IPN18_16420 [Ignavibacteriales bacterium]|nr:hypothetical protein [Ignavibacteriales bacterium]
MTEPSAMNVIMVSSSNNRTRAAGSLIVRCLVLLISALCEDEYFLHQGSGLCVEDCSEAFHDLENDEKTEVVDKVFSWTVQRPRQ